MRLEKYLIEAVKVTNKFYEKFPEAKEDKNFIEWYQEVYNNCQPYLKFLSSQPSEKYFYRGMRGRGSIGKAIPRTDRHPKDTNIAIHKELDRQLEDEFGWKPRSEGVFITSNEDYTTSYGDTYIIFPSGKYQYVWAEGVKDSYNVLDKSSIGNIFLRTQNINSWKELYIKLYGPEGEISNKGVWFYYFSGKPYISHKKDRGDALKDVEEEIKKDVGRDLSIFEKRNFEYYLAWSSSNFKPTDNMKYQDFTWQTENDVMDKIFDLSNKEYDNMREYLVSEILDKKLKYIETGLYRALKSGEEVLLKCDSYYYVLYNQRHDRVKWLNWLIWNK